MVSNSLNRPLFRKATSLVAVVLMLAVLLIVPSPTTHAQLAESPLTSSLDPQPVVDWVQLVRQRVHQDVVSAPRAARIYAYMGVSLYEALYPGMPEYRSMAYQINGLRELPYPADDTTYDWLSVNNAALQTVLDELFADYSEESREAFADLRAEQAEARADEVGNEVVAASLAFGDELGAALLEWIADDRFDRAAEETATYVLPTAASLGLTPETNYLYVQTDPDMPVVEPKFGLLRTLGVENRYECIVRDNMLFSLDEDSAYYQQAMEVFETVNDLTDEQREIAEFWIDTPGESSTPAGHWYSIMSQMVEVKQLTLDRAAMLYGMVGLVLHDSFVTGFGIKYETLTMRPVTFINEHISRRWSSYLVTPQFPEYPSNHSIVSAAAADVLTSLLGIVPFTDTTAEETLGVVRHFYSFEHAADEAAISRLYGGIHYRTAIENGKRIGRCLAEQALDRVQLLPIEQGE